MAKKEKKSLTLKYSIFSEQKFNQAFRTLCNIRDPENFKEFKKILDLAKKLEYHREMYLEMIRNIQKEYGIQDKKTGQYSYENEEIAEKVSDKITEILEVEFELDHKKIPLVSEIQKKLTINEIIGLDKFFII